jgi:hypothetical protein
MDMVPDGVLGYQGPDAVLSEHPITKGRDLQERVRRVATFGGSAFQALPGGNAILTLPRGALLLTQERVEIDEGSPIQAAPPSSDGSPRWTVPVGGWLQGAATEIGDGRVAIFAETGLFSGGPAPDNRQFVINVMRWLAAGR